MSNAQISVSSTGSVKLAGDMNIAPYQTNTSWIYPDETNSAHIGSSTYYFNTIWGYNLKGYATYTQWSTLLTSDKRLKENIRSIDTPLLKLLQLSGWKYDYKPDASDSTLSDKEKPKVAKLKKNKMGFIAQEVKDIFPESVIYDEDEDKYYLDYNSFIPVIVEAMKEQEARIDALEKEIESLKSAPKEKSATLDKAEQASLNQNIPNPFSENTTIEMVVPTTVSSAVLYIYNMQGSQIKQITISERGKTSVTIEGRILKAGMYLYTLISDGKEVDTKKMILTK